MIRPAQLEDLPTIAEFYVDIRMDTVPVVHSVEGVQSWLERVMLPRGSSYVMEMDGQIVGWVDIHGEWLDQLYCRRGFTGQGLGQQMLDFAKQQAPEGLKLYTFQVNQGARRFYARNGFVEIALGDGSGNEEGAPDVCMAWMPAM